MTAVKHVKLGNRSYEGAMKGCEGERVVVSSLLAVQVADPTFQKPCALANLHPNKQLRK